MLFSSKSGKAASQARLAAQTGTTEKRPATNENWINGDRSNTEIALEKKGDINALQRHRYVEYHGKTHYPDVSPHLLNTEEELREVVQEELAIREKEFSSDKSLKERLHYLSHRYWSLSQEWWRWRSGIHHGVGQRGFELWRSHPRWYMHRDLVKYCAGRQGCCARACGCCANRSIDDTRSLGVGHCTLECACCDRARGFEISTTEKKRLKELYKVNTEEGSDFLSRFIVRLSMFGVTGDSWEDPFAMIVDAPPSYEDTENVNRVDQH